MSIERRVQAKQSLQIRLPRKYFAYRFKAVPREQLEIVNGNERFYREYEHRDWHDSPKNSE